MPLSARGIWSSVRALIGRGRFEDGLHEELRFHMDAYRADLERSGVAASEAQRRARIEFGSVDGVKDDCRASRGLGWFDALWRNARHSARVMWKSPGFAAAALLPFALCLGANLAIFAVVDAVLLRPLPFPEAGRLVALYKTYPKVGVLRDGAAPANYYERRGRIDAFDQLATLRHGTAITGETGSTERVEVAGVSPEFFATLGTPLALGRAFTDEEMTYQTDRVAILTDAWWREHFAADPRVIGRTVRLDGVARAVVGVLPPGFRYLSSEARIYVPLASAPAERTAAQRHSGRGGELIARLKPGATAEQAQAQIDALDRAMAHEYHQAKMIADAGYRTVVTPLHADHVATIRPVLLLMQAGVLFLLLIGGVNLVNLLLVRAGARSKELAVRLALGASRTNLVAEVLTETTMLTALGGLLGLAVGAGGIELLAALGTDRLPLGARIEFDARLALIALAASVLIGIVIGLPVAWFNLRHEAAGHGLQAESRGGTAGWAAQRLRHGFIVAQIALAFVLLAGAGLLGRSLEKAAAVSLGFPADHLLSGQLSLPYDHYGKREALLSFTERLLERLRQHPGVREAALATNIPLSGQNAQTGIRLVGRPLAIGELPRVPFSYGVEGPYFNAMRLPLREGRFLTEADSRRPERTCVVDEIFARHYWPQGGALGHRLYTGGRLERDADAFTIVGVVGAAKQSALTEQDSQGAVYFPLGHRSEGHLYLVLRGVDAQPEAFGAAVQKMVREIDPDLPVYDLRSMETRVADSLVARRAPALLAGIFAAMALLLAAVGTYGVLSYAVSQRRREIGVRMALGAEPAVIRGQFFRMGLGLLAAGTAVGIAGAWLAGRAMETLLFGVPAMHIPTLAGAVCVMVVVSLAACVLPSHRAARISPMEALGEE